MITKNSRFISQPICRLSCEGLPTSPNVSLMLCPSHFITFISLSLDLPSIKVLLRQLLPTFFMTCFVVAVKSIKNDGNERKSIVPSAHDALCCGRGDFLFSFNVYVSEFPIHIRLATLLAASSVMFQSECCRAKVLKFFYWLKSSSHPPSTSTSSMTLH